MSIYPVKLSEWFPPGDEMYSNVQSVINCSRCFGCGKKVRYSKAVGHHSVPWGHGEIWHNWKCCESGKEYKLDKRQQRTWDRRMGKLYAPFKKAGL